MRREISFGGRAPRWACLGVAALCAVLLAGCGEGKGKADVSRARPPVPVTVAEVQKKDIPVQVRAIGTVEAYATVSMKSQVNGELQKVHFREGQDVRKGDLLFTIDPRPFEAALREAEARLARSKVLAAESGSNARRYAELVKKDYVTREQQEQIQANSRALSAQVTADEAVVETARLNLSYCFIYAPVTGRAGSLLVDAGNIVKANADNVSMVVIKQVEPIYVSFAIPEQNLARVKEGMAKGSLSVDVSLEDGSSAQGKVDFVDNAVDTTTGTIRLKAVFANMDRRLWPGQFVKAVLTLDVEKGVVVVPSQAVQTGQQGKYLFIVKPDMMAEMRQVTEGRVVGGESVIEKGVAAGEKVVTDGWLRLVPGSRVELKTGLDAGGKAAT